MADNLGLMVAVGGAALIGFAFLSLGKDELAEASEKGSEEIPDINQKWVDPNKRSDGTCVTENGLAVVCADIKTSDLLINECVSVIYHDDGSPWCVKASGVEVPLQIRTEAPERNPFYGIIDWMFGIKRDDIPERTDSPEDTKLYMYSGDPVIESIGTTRPAWLEEQDPDIWI